MCAVLYRLNEFAFILNRSVNNEKNGTSLVNLKHIELRQLLRYYTHEQYLEYIGIVENDVLSQKKVIVYYHESANQKDDMRYQRQALEIFFDSERVAVEEWFYDNGSGLN